VHPSADSGTLAAILIRGAFEYQGQKCSAASRAYVAESVWTRTRDDFIAQVESLTMGDVASDLSLFLGAVIDARAFAKHAAAIDRARNTPSIKILAGGSYDDTEGFFVKPTVLEGSDLADEVFTTEYFGPILAVHVYPDQAYDQVLAQAADASPYALTGSILATDRTAIAQATQLLRYSAGNFYINDKPTGAVVGQQPFGGARASGTDDKAGSIYNLTRWVSARAIKELFVHPSDYRYPYMG
jgi:1-pyrroline-5-carboxylate dehydrogenase